MAAKPFFLEVNDAQVPQENETYYYSTVMNSTRMFYVKSSPTTTCLGWQNDFRARTGLTGRPCVAHHLFFLITAIGSCRNVAEHCLRFFREVFLSDIGRSNKNGTL